MHGRHFRDASTLARVPSLASQAGEAPVTIRPTRAADAEPVGRIIYRAFHGIAARHGFPPDFPTPEAAVALARSFIANPAGFGVAAEQEGRIIGSNFIGEGDAIRGVGPITVDPKAQGRGIGRRLMQAVLHRANGAKGIRLLQDGFNMGSISLYASLGFEVREPVLVVTGRPDGKPPAGLRVRALTLRDLDACAALCVRVHGISRRNELADALRLFAPLVAEREGRITAYMTAPTFWLANHGVAESERDLRDLMLGAAALNSDPLSFLLPTRQAALFRWCLERGMRAVKPMTLMTIGEYRKPAGAYLPSVLY
jgi:predicted N-acetyltransferase YhbS